MDALWNDIRYALRRLLRAPGFALVAILTLAVGIGANTAIFSLVNALLLKPLPAVQQPERLATIFTGDFSSSLYSASSYPDFEDFRAQRDVFSDVAALTMAPLNIALAEQVERLTGEIVTANYFSLLGLRAVAGRLFSATEIAGAAPAIVLSESAWQTRYGGDAGLVGSTVQVNGQPFTVIGIAPPNFYGVSAGMRVDAWLPLPQATHITGDRFRERGSRMFAITARLAPGVTIEQAQQRMNGVRQRLFEAYPDDWTNLAGSARALTVMSERAARVPPDQRGNVFTLAGVLLATVGFVLLICCANVANLLLARAAARQREIVIRYSLGAARSKVVRQLLVESLLLALIGGAGGLLLSAWTTDVLLLRQGSALPLFLNASVDGRVLAFTIGVCVLTALLFGLAPALQGTRANLAALLKTERTLGSSRGPGMRDVLVAAQIALALVLSVSAALLTRTLQHAREVDVGVDPDRVVVARFDLRTQGYDETRQRGFVRELRSRLEQHPAVAAVTFAQRVPIADAGGRRGVSIPGYEPRQGEEMEFPFNVVAADYFETMRLPMVRGRAFNDGDRAESSGVIIVNESFARRFWPDHDGLGKRVRMGERDLTVVGVARDGKYWSMTEAPRPYFYLPAEQNLSPLALHVRARADMSAVIPVVRTVLRDLDPLLPVLALDPMAEQMMAALVPQRIAGGLVGVFALLAILLAGIGVYGVTSVLVVQRVPEIGLRVALGASAFDVLRLVVGRAMMVAAIGIVIGASLALLATRGLESLLFGVSRFDLVSFAVAVGVLGGAALLAAYLPARRAIRLHPLDALSR